MNKGNTHNQFHIRFRRWSRAGYAVFVSLSACVTIGCLAIPVSNQSLQKSICTLSFSNVDSVSESDLYDEQSEQLDLVDNLLEVNLIQIKNNNFDCTTACDLHSLLNIFNQNG